MKHNHTSRSMRYTAKAATSSIIHLINALLRICCTETDKLPAECSHPECPGWEGISSVNWQAEGWKRAQTC